MARESSDWLEPAKDVYRAAQSELIDRWHGPQSDIIEIFKEDLREALLDLKQAVLAGRGPDALQCMDEVAMLLTELRRRSRGD